MRVTGLVLVVPVMEELFWRSFLMRWIDRREFLVADPAQASFLAFALSSALFALEHSQWFAGLVAGMAYSWLYIRAGNLRIPILYAVNARGERTLSGPAIEVRCLELLAQVNLAEKAHRLPRDLTQIEMRKLELARAMAAEPKLLISDEAMAGLSHAEVDEIIALLIRLNEQGVTVTAEHHLG